MTEQNGPFRLISRRAVYQNPWIRVDEDRVEHQSGQTGLFGVVHLKPGSTVLAIDAQDRVCVAREFKYGYRADSIELISGGLDEGESPLDAARRELQEEIGFAADTWTDLGVVNAFTTIMHSPNYIFMATGLKPTGDAEQDPWESIEAQWIPFEDAFRMVQDGRITHAASCVAILKAALLRRD